MTGRYARQMALPEVGIEGQARLTAARVLVVGAGGLGCPLLQYLAAAGVGRLVVVDHDVVEESNLHRQPLYTMNDLGQPKVAAARAALLRLNPGIDVEARNHRVTPDNVAALVGDADVVVDATDSRAVTYVLNDACQSLGRPLVSASALALSGYVGAFCGGAPSYRAVFPDMPERAANCSSSGVLGSLVAVIGSLQAQLVLQLLLQISPSPLGRLLRFDASRLGFASFDFHGAPEPDGPQLHFISPQQVTRDDLVVDLRGLDEAPVSPFAQARRLVVDTIDSLAETAPSPDTRVVLCCHSGLRAWRAGRRLRELGIHRLALVALADE